MRTTMESVKMGTDGLENGFCLIQVPHGYELSESDLYIFKFDPNNIFYTIYLIDRPVGIYLLKVNSRNTRTRSEIYSKIIIKNGPSKICGREPFSNFLKAVFHKFYLVHS